MFTSIIPKVIVMKCQICEKEYDSKKGMSAHLRSHDISSEEYTVKYLCDGERPKCPVCGEETSYQSFDFDTFCSDHKTPGSNPEETILDNDLLREMFVIEAENLLHPAQISMGSGRDILWRCSQGHIFESSPSNFSRQESDCPCCSGATLCLKGSNSLKGKYPRIASEWHPDKNDISPKDILPSGKTKRWWKCDAGHEWKSTISNRVHNGSGCPECAGRQVTGEKKCKECGKSFSGNNGLYTHVALSHEDVGLEKYKMKYEEGYSSYECGICDSEFPSKQKLNLHVQNDHDIERREYEYSVNLNMDQAPRCNADDCGRSQKYDKFHGFLSTCGSQKCIEKVQYGKVSKDEIVRRLNKDGFQLVNPDKKLSTKDKAILRCAECDHTFERFLYAQFVNDYSCPNCNDYSVSFQEEEIRSWLQQYTNFKTNLASLIPPYEIDIYLPSYNLGIEHHGLYWHSDYFKEPEYHYSKFVKSEQNGIKLLQFFGDQWREKEEICKSIILHKLGKTPNVIYARDCRIMKIDDLKRMRNFFDENHIQGSASNSSWGYGLKYEGELISCISVRTAMHYDANEIARYCNKKFHHIPGGLSRLMSRVIDRSGKDIISYADLMHGDGSGYEKLGFEFVKDTVVNYWYTDFTQRIPRHHFQATEEKSEKEIAEEAGVRKIYGAGNKLYKLELKNG